jgi:membrane associated rhomboid family serine protease
MLLMIVLVVGGFAVYVMTPEERKRVLRSIEDRLWQVRDPVDALRAQDAPFREALRARTSWPIVTPAIVAISVLVFLAMAAGSGSFGSSDTLVGWGASFGPRTTNGEWWRLATALVVHAGFLHVVFDVIGLTQAGITLERLLGRFALATAFVAAGLLSNLQFLSSNPMGIATGASGAVFGVYGLLFATLTWGVLQRRSSEVLQLGNLREETGSLSIATGNGAAGAEDSVDEPRRSEAVTIPVQTLARIAPSFGLFVLYNLAGGTLDASAAAGLLTGFLAGLLFARHATERTTPVMHVAAAVGVTAVIVIASAAMLRGVADVRPEIARVIALEDRTAGVYEKAVNQFRKGALSAQALAKLINQAIVPELQAAHAHLKTVRGVPAEHKPLVENAEEYFRLRGESWRLRADALFKSNMVALRAADRSERASLEALARIRSVPTESTP